MLFGIRLRNNETGDTRMLTTGARSKINARRLADRIRKRVRRQYGPHISVEVVRID